MRRKKVNIALLILNLLLIGAAVWIVRQPDPSVPVPTAAVIPAGSDIATSVSGLQAEEPTQLSSVTKPQTDEQSPLGTVSGGQVDEPPHPPVISATLPEVRTGALTASGNPFRQEAIKMLSGKLEESDSLSRRKILNYCEHLRAAYPTRDLDFIRQVFSDYALIIVGHTVRPAKGAPGAAVASEKVRYSVRSKQQYLDQLAKIFNSGKEIAVSFSDFKIMCHPTMKGIYGVTLKQRYRCGSYADQGWLFLLWDFRNPSMPLIHVRTWQPEGDLNSPADVIGIADFDLE